MNKTRICHICGTEVGEHESCPTCTAAFPNRTNADEMTGDDRAAEMDLLYGVLEFDFELLQQRISELVGRPVWTHEMIYQEQLTEEARNRRPLDMDTVLSRLPNKPTVVVAVP